jgi:hypothetical protein
MGVLACDRKGCERIMCDYYSPEHGYICWECIQELKERAIGDGTVDVYKFMATAKGSADRAATVEDIDDIFRDRR